MAAEPVPVSNWRGAQGEAEIARFAQRCVVVRLSGSAEQPAAKVIESALRGVFQSPHSWDVFWDLETLTNYHSDVRVLSTNVLLAHRDKLASVHAYSTSKIVTMGVSVASLALGGLIIAHKTRESFHGALQAAQHRGPANASS